jgi:hypothetical protein
MNYRNIPIIPALTKGDRRMSTLRPAIWGVPVSKNRNKNKQKTKIEK